MEKSDNQVHVKDRPCFEQGREQQLVCI